MCLNSLWGDLDYVNNERGSRLTPTKLDRAAALVTHPPCANSSPLQKQPLSHPPTLHCKKPFHPINATLKYLFIMTYYLRLFVEQPWLHQVC